jgi:Septum formation
MRGVIVRLGILGVILIAAFILRPFITGSAGDLNVGDCFDPPTEAGVEVKDVQHHPCSDLHGGEVVYVGKIADLTVYPTDDQVAQFVEDNCLAAYTAYTGVDLFSTDGADLGYFSPTEDGWTKGDRGVICYATRLDNAPTKGSVKKS